MSSHHDPCEASQSHSPPLDHTCVFSQGWRIRSHGFMGPQVKQLDVAKMIHTSYTLTYMWDMLLEGGWAHLPLEVGWPHQGPNQPEISPTASIHASMHLSWLEPLIKGRFKVDGSKGHGEEAHGSLTWHNLYLQLQIVGHTPSPFMIHSSCKWRVE